MFEDNWKSLGEILPAVIDEILLNGGDLESMTDERNEPKGGETMGL